MLTVLDNPDRVAAWGEIFAGRVWPDEGRAAVRQHYAKPNAFALMPGDVIAYCDAQPPWSSEAHARDWLSRRHRYPASRVIEAYTGITEPDLMANLPTMYIGQPWKTVEPFLADKLRRWVLAHEDELVAAILERKHTPVWAQ